ncbi:MAG TPA: hypothetical protein VL334_01055 [Anaerolineae bacterium]|nr:hypothetical protein [Anaerolineae bacterium]
MDRRLLFSMAVGLALLLAGCSATKGGTDQPSLIPLSSAPDATPPLSQLTPRATAATATPLTEREVPAADLDPTVEIVVRGGRLASASNVSRQPGGEVVGRLPAGALAIITGSRGEWLEIIFGDAPGGHGWVPRAAVSFPAVQPAAVSVPTSEPAAEQTSTSQPEAAQPAAPAPAATASPQAALFGTLVFQDSNGGNIYLMNADGSGLRRLTYGFDPAFSPDGRQVAFTRWDEPRGLWVINVDGSGERLLIGANRARSPTWTPDGAVIVFERASGSATCFQSPFGCLSADTLQALFGGQPCLTTPFGSFCIADFAQVTSSLTGLVRYELASGVARDLPASQTATAPRHQPQGTAVIYLDKGALALTQDLGDAPPQRLIPAPPLLAPATFSPDGQFIYAARHAGNRWDLWRWRADGSQPVALTTPDPLTAQPASNVAPAVSPDGRTVVFLTNRSGPWQLWLMNSDGSNLRPLAPQALAGIGFHYDFNSDRVVDWGP